MPKSPKGRPKKAAAPQKRRSAKAVGSKSGRAKSSNPRNSRTNEPAARRRNTKQSKAKQNRTPQSGRPNQNAIPGPSGPKGLGGNQVEGRQAVRELLLAGKRRVHEVLLIDDSEGDSASVKRTNLDPIIADIADLANELGVKIVPLNRKKFLQEAVTQSHQGVLARAASLSGANLDTLLADPAAFLVVVDGVTDPQNLGSILRTAECAGVTGVIMGKHRSAKITPTVSKAAAGAIEHVPIVLVGGIPAALAEMEKAEIFSVGLDEAGTNSIYSLSGLQTRKIALVLGAEGKGLSRLVKERVDLLASIPLAGYLNSLNVGTASAVACFEVVRTRSSI